MGVAPVALGPSDSLHHDEVLVVRGHRRRHLQRHWQAQGDLQQARAARCLGHRWLHCRCLLRRRLAPGRHHGFEAQRADQAGPAKPSVGSIYSEIGFGGLWAGLGTRIFMIGTLTAFQWLIYDSFKVYMGLPTTGSAAPAPEAAAAAAKIAN